MTAIARKLENITAKGGMRLVDVANVLGTRPETVSRWNQGKAFPHPATEKQLRELEWVIEQLADFYGVCWLTFQRWVKKNEDQIGKKTGHFYSINQVLIIFKIFGMPKRFKVSLSEVEEMFKAA